MTILEVQFGVWLGGQDSPFGVQGALFHRWLPNGELDAIEVPTEDKAARVKVWFDRKGYVENGWIKYDHKRTEIPEELMRRQALLDAGALLGRITLNDVSQEQLDAVQGQQEGNVHYVAVGKRVAKYVYKAVLKVVRVLKWSYGQYWLEEPSPWDSRNQTVGSYLHGRVQVWFDSRDGRRPFRPNSISITLTSRVGATKCADYITELDWQAVARAISGGSTPPISARTLVEANRLAVHGQLRQAVVEAATALEIALNDFARKGPATAEELGQFLDLGLRAKLIIMAAIRRRIDRTELDTVLKLVALRNGIVHEGINPPEESFSLLDQAMVSIAKWIPAPRPRLLSPDGSNVVYPE